MKLNLLIDNPAGVRPGYLNLDPLATTGDRSRMACSPNNLASVCEAAEAQEILALDVLDYIPFAEVNQVLDHWVSRLAHRGLLSVSVVDFNQVTRAFQDRRLNLGEVNALLHGEQKKSWQFRQSAHTMGDLTQSLVARGLELSKQRYADYRAIVVARRP